MHWIILNLTMNFNVDQKLGQNNLIQMKSNQMKQVKLKDPGRRFQQSDLIGSVSDSNRNLTKLDENFINRRNPIGFRVAIRHPDP